MRNDLLQALREMRATYPLIDLRDRATFIRNLVFVHNVITASEKLLEVAAAESTGELRSYFEAHLAEERGHVQWLAEDLASAGIDVGAMPVLPLAMAMAGSQYYLIYHDDPAALLGYMAMLECFPATGEQIRGLEEAHGADLCRTLRYHATHDVDHGADVLNQIDKLSAQQFGTVKRNAIQTATYIGAAIQKMTEAACTA